MVIETARPRPWQRRNAAPELCWPTILVMSLRHRVENDIPIMLAEQSGQSTGVVADD